jgi:hypothetical protein
MLILGLGSSTASFSWRVEVHYIHVHVHRSSALSWSSHPPTTKSEPDDRYTQQYSPHHGVVQHGGVVHLVHGVMTDAFVTSAAQDSAGKPGICPIMLYGGVGLVVILDIPGLSMVLAVAEMAGLWQKERTKQRKQKANDCSCSCIAGDRSAILLQLS